MQKKFDIEIRKTNKQIRNIDLALTDQNDIYGNKSIRTSIPKKSKVELLRQKIELENYIEELKMLKEFTR